MVQPWRVESSESMVPPSVATGLRAFAARRIRNWAAAEDVSQEALRIGVEALAAGRIPSPAALPGFLFRTAANLCLHHGRSAARESRALQRLASRGAERTGEGGDAFDTLLSAERRARLLRALGRLEHAERRLLQMTYRDELSSQEIGRRLGITCGAVRARRHRALRRLAALLAGTAPPRPRILRILPLALLALVAFLGGASGSAQEVRQFSAPQPCDIAEGPDGAMWFAEGPFRKIGRIDGTGAVTEFQIGKDTFSVARGLDGNLWFTTPAALGRMTPRGELTWHPVAHATQVVPSPDGNLWFTTWRSDGATSIGRVTPGGAVTEFPLSAGSPTYDSAWDPCPDTRVIAAALDGGAWYARPCAGKLGRVTASGTVVEFALPGPRSPRRIAVGPDGNLWFTESLPAVGRLSPSGDLAEFPLSGGAHGIVAGIDGNLWAAGRGTLSRLTTTGAVTQFPVPIDTETPAIAAALDGTLWITDREAGRIVRFAPARDTTACVADASSLCLDGGRFRVAADWSSDTSAGRGHAVNLSPNSGYFWFFDPANLEVVVKVLNGCAVNGHHWAFAAGLTNVEVRTTVTDTSSGATRTYTNPRGTPFAPLQDTTTFAACP